ncbi:MAG TPA: response regulator [Longimicrobium sp.]|nr:response regulator [Longimicrobium sp.]
MSPPAHDAAVNAAPRRSLAALLVLLGLVLALVWMGYNAFRALSAANRGSIHTYQVLTRTDEMRTALAEMEAGFRGYALTGSPRFHEQWERGREAFIARLDSARRLTADSPEQQRALAEADRGFRELARLQERAGVLQAAPAQRARAVAGAYEAAAASGRAEQADRVRAVLAGVEQREGALLRRRAERADRLERQTGALILLDGVLVLLLAAGAGGVIYRRNQRLAEVNRRLEAEAAEKQLARETLERNKRQNELILESAAEGIYGIDRDGYTQFLNDAAGRMLGRDPVSAVGRPVEAVLGLQADAAGGPDPIRATLAGGGAVHVADAAFRRADGTRFPTEYSCTPIREGGRVTGAVITFRDVTERREVERMKDEFISVVSHELRTPLTSIRGSLGLLAAGKLGEVPEKGRRMLDIAVQNSDRLIRLINDILDIERIESGRVTMELRPADAAELAAQAVDVMAAMAERGGVHLVLRATPQRVLADADRVLQVLSNLLSNAVKFSPPESEVAVEVGREGDDVVFRVRDAGRGVPADRLESIFERFQQVDSSDSRQKGGTGLGLAISRSIVQQHGGRIWAESAPGQGSVFTFTLPAAMAPEEPSPARVEGQGPLVLVCEDEPEVLERVTGILHQWGYRTLGVPDGETAVREAALRRPDAVLLDMRLPGMNGSETLRQLRDLEETRGIPVVVLSVLEAIPRIVESGAVSGWLDKPVEEGTLVQALEGALRRGGAGRRVLLVEDDPDLSRVLMELFERHGVEAVHAASGQEAVAAGRAAPPDLVVLDLALPDGDGFWVVEALRRETDGVPPALMVYTARELPEDERERLRLGTTEFVTKGRVTPEEFERRVVALLNRIAAPGRGAAAAAREE